MQAGLEDWLPSHVGSGDGICGRHIGHTGVCGCFQKLGYPKMDGL